MKLISIIVPTKDRLNFLPNILRNYYRQDYPKKFMELIIGDYSIESIKKYLPDDDTIKYFKLENMSIGKKRNLLCEKAKGDIIIFMDDDDYIPKERVSHSVENLKDCEITGCSEIFVYYAELNKIYKYGPLSENHATCGTLAFTKEYFNTNKFNNKDYKSEEYFFLNKFTEKIKQLDTKKVILCIAHMSNTVDKKKFIKDKYLSDYNIEDFIKEKEDLIFFKSLYKN